LKFFQKFFQVAIEADQAVFQFYKSGVVTSAECGKHCDCAAEY